MPRLCLLQPGMGEQLEPVSGLHIIRRGVYETDHAGYTWAVEVDYFDFSERIRLYRDDTLVETRKSPARFRLLDDAAIEASMGLLGMKRVALVRADGAESPLRPAAGTAEAHRAAFDCRYPTFNRVLAGLAWLVLVVALIVEIPQIVGLVGNVAGFEVGSPFGLPGWATGAIGALALVAVVDRALRFQHNRWLD
jgi:hypothetical protein